MSNTDDERRSNSRGHSIIARKLDAQNASETERCDSTVFPIPVRNE